MIFLLCFNYILKLCLYLVTNNSMMTRVTIAVTIGVKSKIMKVYNK